MNILQADADKEIEDDTQIVQILMEGHMILPGLLSIMGLQIVSVFNNVFQEQLQPFERVLHLAALGLLGIGVGLVLTPAAYHRQVAPQTIPNDFQRLASRFITVAMVPLMLALTIDIYLVAKLALKATPISVALAVGMLILFGGLWFVFPQIVSHQRARNSKREQDSERGAP
jgi:hypothetical protein